MGATSRKVKQAAEGIWPESSNASGGNSGQDGMAADSSQVSLAKLLHEQQDPVKPRGPLFSVDRSFFECVPDDVLMLLFAFIEWRSLGAFVATCKRFQQFFTRPLFRQAIYSALLSRMYLYKFDGQSLWQPERGRKVFIPSKYTTSACMPVFLVLSSSSELTFS